MIDRIRRLVGNRGEARVAGQAGFLFALDLLTNVIDYVFHVYLGRVLVAGDFAVVQALNAALLIVIITSGVMQPVVARYIAEAEAEAVAGGADDGRGRTIFQRYFVLSAGVGLLLTALVWLGRRPIAGWLNVPAAVVGVGSLMVVLSLMRPVVVGVLQGQQRFAAFGVSRAVFAAGRLALVVLFIRLGGGVVAVVATMPLAGVGALLMGLALLGRGVWRRGAAVPAGVLWAGLRLSAGTFVALAANTALQSNDVIWVNRAMTAEVAGAYAGAVLLRRALALLPGAVVVIFFPRVVAAVTQKRVPDRLLAIAITATLLPTLLLTMAYAVGGPLIIRLVFGGAYSEAGRWLGWMGLGVLGYMLASIWLNLFLATRPLPYIGLLAGTAVAQVLALAWYHDSVGQMIGIFSLAGWVVAIGGGVLYLFWLRPRLVLQSRAVTV